MATVCWTTYTNPKTLINVGMDTLAMQNRGVIYFYNLKTNAVSFYKPDNPQMGAGVGHLAGHNRFALFAFTEAILQPSIYIMRYPELTKFHIISGTHIFNYADLRFSEFDHLIALSGHPNFTIYIWNIRTHQLIVEHDTHKASAPYSLYCSANNIPVVVQFSELLKEVYLWELCLGTESSQLHEISTIKVFNDNEYSKIFFFCFGDDGQLYLVNDYGNVYSAEMAEFRRKLQYSIPYEETTTPMAHCLFFHKAGLILTNKNSIYFIKKKGVQNWYIEWSIDHTNVDIAKMVYNFNNEIYAVDKFGNVFAVEVAGEMSKLVQQTAPSHYLVKKCLLLKGVKEDSVLMLTRSGELLLVDIMRNNHLSKIVIENAETMTAHNQSLFVVVGTSFGAVHFVSFEKLRAPVIIGLVDLETTTKIERIRLLDSKCYVQDANQKFHMIDCDYKHSVFNYIFKAKKWDILVMDHAIIDDNTFLLFISTKLKEPLAIKYIEELWICQYRSKNATLKEYRYSLPHKYVCFSIGPLTQKNAIEIFGIRFNDYVIDIYNVVDLNGLVLMTTLMTHHFSNILGLGCVKNIITWGVDSIIIHFRSHKKSNKPYIISRTLQMHYLAEVEEDVADCLNGKYLVIHQSNGCFKTLRLPVLSDNLRENIVVPDTNLSLDPYKTIICKAYLVSKELDVFEPTPAELKARAHVENLVEDLKEVMRNLIDYDISVTGKTHGTFRKFCLNQSWLDGLNEQARFLFTVERNSLLESIKDQTRIRDWIMHLVTHDSITISSKLRSLFSKTFFENYSTRKKNPEYMAIFDLYLFYDMDAPEEEIVGGDDEEEEKEEEVTGTKRSDKRFVKMDNMFDHIFDDAFMVADKDIVTCNQIYNAMVKTKLILMDSLKEEFNKKYNEVRQLKQELMDSIFGTNATLTRIYENMNIMLRLLNMATFEMPFLSIPEWMKDEVLERILTVDDSEIKAINRRKKKQTLAEHKSGRMLLWSVEFWIRALITMMDGVLEKLWEEEIKKDIPIPEFMIKKQDHEYNLEDQKQLREYNEKVRILGEDRRKYLRILNENEQKTLVFKSNLIMKCNQKITEMATLKLKYDFAVKQEMLRLMSLRKTHHTRIHLRQRMDMLKDEEYKVSGYIVKYNKLQTYWEKTVSDIKAKVDHLQVRDKTLEKQFRGHFLNIIPAHLTHEMNKLFKRHPKMTQKSFNSTMVCMEVAARITPHHQKHRVEFPLPGECFEYLAAMDALDDASNAPNQLDTKHWDIFCKLRRQKVENELKIKGISYQLLDAQNALSFLAKEGCTHLRDARQELLVNMEETAMDYYEAIINQKLQITLPMGQVEIGVGGSMETLKSCILMNMSDINEVNELIRTAGAKKLRAMQRVALFRRNVIFKEWEHKVVRANIDYLNYILKVIEKCKVTIEFRDVLRKWQNNKDRKKTTSVVGILERVVEQKIAAFRKNLERILDKIDDVRAQIDHMKSLNKKADKDTDDIRIAVAMAEVQRDYLGEERRTREQKERMDKIKAHRHLIESVRHDYAQILELSTILELQRLRTYPTLGPAPVDCPEPNFVSM